jgi:hypothetical protein
MGNKYYWTKEKCVLVIMDSDMWVNEDNLIELTESERLDYLSPKPPVITMDKLKYELQEYCDKIAKSIDGDYKNSTEVLVYAAMGDEQAKVFASWYDSIWDAKAILTIPPEDIDAWIKSYPYPPTVNER